MEHRMKIENIKKYLKENHKIIFSIAKKCFLTFISIKKVAGELFIKYWTPIYKYTFQKILIKNFQKRTSCNIEIGPGDFRIPNFFAVNIIKTPYTDFVVNLETENLPFRDNSIDLIYTSHFIEHIAWYHIDHIFEEFTRVLKPGGVLEIWIPDGQKIANIIIQSENQEINTVPDGWIKFNDEQHPIIWCNGRIFYGANPHYPSWHKAIYTYGYLSFLLKKYNFKKIERLTPEECRGVDHGWINLGIRGIK